MRADQKKLKVVKGESTTSEGINERAETRCSQSRKQTPSSRAAKETTKKEKWVRKKLGTKMNSKKATSRNLRIVTEQWLDKLCYKVKLEKYIEKNNQKKHNIMFQ